MSQDRGAGKGWHVLSLSAGPMTRSQLSKEAFQSRAEWVAYLTVDPQMDTVRRDPRYTTLLKLIDHNLRRINAGVILLNTIGGAY